MKVRITFTEPLLGTMSGNPKVAEEFILSRHPDGLQEDELHALTPEEDVEKQTTVFARDKEGKPHLWDYQIKGFLKEACMAMIMSDAYTKDELKSVRLTEYLYKRTIDKLVFVAPRKIYLNFEGKITSNERPLRKDSFKGGIVALVRSEESPVGTTIDVDISTMNKKLLPFITTWLDYGCLSGIGQWRNASYGRFEWALLMKD